MSVKEKQKELLDKIMETARIFHEIEKAHYRRNNCILTNSNGNFLGFGCCTPWNERIGYLKEHNLPEHFAAFEIYI